MRTLKGIVCLTCGIEHQPGEGYQFTEDHSLICNQCGKILFATTQSSEDKMPKFYTIERKSRNGTTPISTRSHYASYDCD